MQKLILILLIVTCGAYSTKAQQRNDAESVLKWFNKCLNDVRNKESIQNYKASFFKTDSVRIIGYIENYDASLGFASGIIYNANDLTREDFPTSVRIMPDGRFDVKFEIQYPVLTSLLFNNDFYKFYIEPGQTLGMIFKNENGKLNFLSFKGVLAHDNDQLSAFEWDNQNQKFYNTIEKLVKGNTPEQSKAQIMKSWDQTESSINHQLVSSGYSSKIKELIQSEVQLNYASQLLDYAMYHEVFAKQDSTNDNLKIPLPPDFYDFIYRLDLNKKSYLAIENFSTFINRFEYSPLFVQDDFNKQISKNYQDSYAVLDSANRKANPRLINSTMYEVAKLRTLRGRLTYSIDSIKIENYQHQINATLQDPFFKKQVELLVQKRYANNKPYELGDTYGSKMFKQIVDKYKGKVVIVDFWAQSCGPCRASIEAMKTKRLKLKDNPNLQFVFITDSSGTPDMNFYKSYTAENNMYESHIVSSDDYLAFRELFKFNGIPRYILIDADGKIRNADFALHNWKYELTKHYPQYFNFQMLNEI
ncbi:putative thiol:disulfide interchange protein [Sphingobacterium faecium PCAi_F2.5]|nr:putative thiol:disulfide interchange protein [Sphingobacterium faecium PCAi_F2.5]